MKTIRPVAMGVARCSQAWPHPIASTDGSGDTSIIELSLWNVHYAIIE